MDISTQFHQAALGADIKHQPVTRDSLAAAMATSTYRSLADTFVGWPELSLMGPHGRAVLYTLTRMLRPAAVAEIGTLHAGTSEVLARALHENGDGMLYTTDPYGADRCPPIIAAWPEELRRRVEFHPLNSMDFLQLLGRRRIRLSLTLVDGNHDYEFALFDLQMSARLTEPGGVIVMDNAEQTGPFEATRTFLAANPAWRELGDAVIGRHDPTDPFDAKRGALPKTAFIVLRAPTRLSIGATPWSTGVMPIAEPRVAGFAFTLSAPANGTLYYRCYVRAFADENRWIGEIQTKGSARIDGDGRIEERFAAPLVIDVPAQFGTTVPCNVEIDVYWAPDNARQPLELLSALTPILTS
ncbi:MAG: class I SAM-dependent methyltransferase [Rhodospirillales bacterium]|nr:class I SAM-dependent methyltransferase [Rhodospirillales bacterium]